MSAEPFYDREAEQWVYDAPRTLRTASLIASREEAPATPPAAIPAAPSDGDEQTPSDIMWTAYEKDLPHARLTVHSSHFNASAPVWFERGYRAARTQPTTVQQAEPDEKVREAGRTWAYAEGHEYPGESADAYLQGHRAALKTAQTTALPGGNGEGES